MSKIKESKIKNSGIIHHRFPSNPELLKYWLELCPLGYVVKDSSRLCAKHFDGNSIFLTPKNRGKRLLPTAKPIIDIQQDGRGDRGYMGQILEKILKLDF